MGITIEDAGVFTTLQDAGRTGYQQFGVSVSGAMDMEAFRLANLLAGNDRDEGALEMTYKGPSIRFEEDEVIAVTGADMRPVLNGESVPVYTALAVRAGDLLEMGFASRGARGYLAFAGGLAVEPVMGSVSTLASKGIGGIEGRALKKGDRIGLKAPKGTLSRMERRSLVPPVYPTDSIAVRVVPGPQDDAFSPEELRNFFWYGAEITNDFDRMGCRLKRETPLKHLGDGNIISDGIAAGSIQVPTNGQPIIMLSDRQTVGGYAKIGTVITADLPKIAQSRPGMKIRFIRVSMDLAQDLYIRSVKEMDAIDTYLNA